MLYLSKNGIPDHIPPRLIVDYDTFHVNAPDGDLAAAMVVRFHLVEPNRGCRCSHPHSEQAGTALGNGISVLRHPSQAIHAWNSNYPLTQVLNIRTRRLQRLSYFVLAAKSAEE
jgi:hypothetical protein